MNILSIETSCDETAVSLVRATGGFPHATYTVLGNALFSQASIHAQYGGVFPAVAKREHARTLVPMLAEALQQANVLTERIPEPLPNDQSDTLRSILAREPALSEATVPFLESHIQPPIDLIAVTHGPGLEPALWVGVNFARALSLSWGAPIVPVNHMEGHVLSSIFKEGHLDEIAFPAIALLISGGHTELILIKDWLSYELIGKTRDDAVGEAFDKVARMLGLPYPGGPEISKLADAARAEGLTPPFPLPRPMLDAQNLDFSFSGLKTAVRYGVDGTEHTPREKSGIAREFEDSVTEVLIEKTRRAIDQNEAKTLILGGGVTANRHIRASFREYFMNEYPMLTVYIPDAHLSTDNSVMIALAGHAKAATALRGGDLSDIKAEGNLSLNDCL